MIKIFDLVDWANNFWTYNVVNNNERIIIIKHLALFWTKIFFLKKW